MNRTDIPTYHYTISEYDGSSPYTSNRKGMSGDPIKFYELSEDFVSPPSPTAEPPLNENDASS